MNVYEPSTTGTIATVTWSRIGPVYLYWSEYDDAAVIGPEQGAWGGDDVYRCDVHPDWQGEGIVAGTEHCLLHGFIAP